MKYLKASGFVCMLLLAFCLAGQAADKPSAANRAYLYQQEARTVLGQHHWRISQDQSGKLVANRLDQPAMPIPFSTVATLTLTFQPDGLSHTNCAANIVSNTYEKARGVARKFNGPLPYNTPKNTKEIQEMLIEAEKRLTATHPEYTKQ